MITINLLPYHNHDDGPSSISWSDPVIHVDGVEYDLSLLDDRASAQHPILGTVFRNGDDYSASLKLPFGSNAPESTRFPEPIIVTENGPVELPIYNTPEPEDNQEIIDDLA